MISPEYDDLLAILREIEDQSDRAAGIMGAALVQDCLKDAIIARMVNADSHVQDLFKLSGALSSFSSQISLAHGIGLIGTNAYRDLNCIRGIRNKFAHWNLITDSQRKRKLLSFETQQIAAWAGNIKFPDERGPRIWLGNEYVAPTDPRERYIFSCAWMSRALLHSHDAKFLEEIPFKWMDY